MEFKRNRAELGLSAPGSFTFVSMELALQMKILDLHLPRFDAGTSMAVPGIGRQPTSAR